MEARTVRWVCYHRFLKSDVIKPVEDFSSIAKLDWPETAYSRACFERRDIVIDGEVFKGDPVKIGIPSYLPEFNISKA